MDRDGLADFLRRRRAALSPADVGLPPGRRRRAPGLRREEVAARAHISTDFYTRLEQRRGARPSESTVAALALALGLDELERDHLFALAGHNAPPTARRGEGASPGLLRVLEQIEGAAAMIVSDLGVTLAQNELAKALFGDHSVFTGPARSIDLPLVHRTGAARSASGRGPRGPRPPARGRPARGARAPGPRSRPTSWSRCFSPRARSSRRSGAGTRSGAAPCWKSASSTRSSAC